MTTFAFPLHAMPIEPSSIEVTERNIFDTAKTFLLREGRIPPMVHLIGPNMREDCPHAECIYYADVSPFMGSEDGRDLLAEIMPQICQDMQIHTVVTVMESWTVEGSGPDAMESVMQWKEKHGSLENHPDVVEVISLMVETRLGTRLATYPIVRGEDGSPTGLKENTRPDTGTVCGRFANWLRPRPDEVS